MSTYLKVVGQLARFGKFGKTARRSVWMQHVIANAQKALLVQQDASDQCP